MGRFSLEGMIEHAEFRQALAWHLSSNHYPAIPSVMIEPCAQAIANANAGDWDSEIQLPNGVLWRGGSTTCPTSALIEYAHLESFLDSDYDEIPDAPYDTDGI